MRHQCRHRGLVSLQPSTGLPQGHLRWPQVSFETQDGAMTHQALLRVLLTMSGKTGYEWTMMRPTYSPKCVSLGCMHGLAQWFTRDLQAALLGQAQVTSEAL